VATRKKIIFWTLARFTLGPMLGLSLACSLAATGDGLKIAAIGTSLTAQGGWQAQLQKDMTECLGVPVTVTNHARSGETSRWGIENIDVILAERPDIVLIEFAVNDAALNRFISLSQSVENMRAIVQAVRTENSRAIIIIQAMNPLWGFRRWIRPFLDRYIEAHATLAQELGVDFVDHRPLWAAYSDAEIKRMVPDGAHPLPGYSASMIAAHIKSWLIEKYFSGRCVH
jgi:acyl-CoA thioesterase-1